MFRHAVRLMCEVRLIGRQLAPPRDEGVLTIGSGKIVHNLRAVDVGHAETGFDWAQRFDEHAPEGPETNPSSITAFDRHRDFDLAVPTPGRLPTNALHRRSANGQPNPLVDGQVAGSVSVAAYTLGMTRQPDQGREFSPHTNP